MSAILDRLLAVIPQMDKESLEVQLRMVINEINTSLAAITLRQDFTNEEAKSVIVTKFFLYYDMLTPEQKEEFRANVDDLGKKYLDAWVFAGLEHYPFRNEVARTYLNSINGKTTEDILEHIKECEIVKTTLEKRFEGLSNLKSVV